LAFKKINKINNSLHLVFVGAEDYFYIRLKKFIAENHIKRIIFPGFIPDHELDVIFTNSLAYIRPSLYEGFELPPLEAMAKGVPVISSDHSCALEILGDSAYYFDPLDVSKIAEAIIKVCEDESLRSNLIKKGYKQTQRYSWKKTAQETLNIYKKTKKI
jgi:glycosyltransferase involved in cell wall biosynthesis